MSRPPRRAPRGFSVAAAAATALAAAGGVAIAGAESEGEPIRLEYRAGPGCPDEEAFLAHIRRRAARAHLVREGEHARTFTVELAAGTHPSGSVTVTDGLRTEGTRRLDADTCDDVADALALMVALALDPRTQTVRDASPDPTPVVLLDAGPSLPAPVTEEPPASDSSVPDSSSPPAPSSPGPEEADVAAPAPPSLRRPLHFFGGLDLAVATDVTPNPLFAGSPYFGWHSTRAALLGPSVRASFLRAGTGTLSAPGGAASFTWTVGRLDGCAMLWPDRPLRIGACVRAEVGMLDASGEQIVGARTQHRAWVAGGALARVEWSFFGPLLLDAGLGPSFRITADRFYFLPGTNVDEVPYVGFVAEAGAGVHFL